MAQPGADVPRTIDEVMRWRADVTESVARHRALVLRAVDSGASAGDRFVGMTRGEVEEHFDELYHELDLFARLGLIAAGEAAVKLYFRRRMARKPTDPLARRFRAFFATLNSRMRRRPPLDENGILDELEASGRVEKRTLDEFRECLRARNWIAHGRGEARPRAVDQFPPAVVYTRVRDLLDALPP